MSTHKFASTSNVYVDHQQNVIYIYYSLRAQGNQNIHVWICNFAMFPDKMDKP